MNECDIPEFSPDEQKMREALFAHTSKPEFWNDPTSPEYENHILMLKREMYLIRYENNKLKAENCELKRAIGEITQIVLGTIGT